MLVSFGLSYLFQEDQLNMSVVGVAPPVKGIDKQTKIIELLNNEAFELGYETGTIVDIGLIIGTTFSRYN